MVVSAQHIQYNFEELSKLGEFLSVSFSLQGSFEMKTWFMDGNPSKITLFSNK